MPLTTEERDNLTAQLEQFTSECAAASDRLGALKKLHVILDRVPSVVEPPAAEPEPEPAKAEPPAAEPEPEPAKAEPPADSTHQ